MQVIEARCCEDYKLFSFFCIEMRKISELQFWKFYDLLQFNTQDASSRLLLYPLSSSLEDEGLSRVVVFSPTQVVDKIRHTIIDAAKKVNVSMGLTIPAQVDPHQWQTVLEWKIRQHLGHLRWCRVGDVYCKNVARGASTYVVPCCSLEVALGDNNSIRLIANPSSRRLFPYDIMAVFNEVGRRLRARVHDRCPSPNYRSSMRA